MALSCPVFGTITQTDTGSIAACGSSPCGVSMNAATNGGAAFGLVAIISGMSGTVAVSSISGSGGTWVQAGAGCKAKDTGIDRGVDIWYNLSESSSATSISVSFTGSTNTSFFGDAWVYEFKSSLGTFVFDVCGTKDDSTAATTQTGPTLTLTGSGDGVVQVMSMASSATGTTASTPYDTHVGIRGQSATSWAVTSSGAAVTWTPPSSVAVMTGAIGLTETSTAPPTMPPAVY